MKTFMIVLIVLMIGIGTESLAFDPDQEYVLSTIQVKKDPLFKTKWTLVDSDFQNLKLKWKFDKVAFDYDIKDGWLERTDVQFMVQVDPNGVDRLPGANVGFVFTIKF